MISWTTMDPILLTWSKQHLAYTESVILCSPQTPLLLADTSPHFQPLKHQFQASPKRFASFFRMALSQTAEFPIENGAG